MKKIYLLITFFAISLSGWSQLLTEDFNYTAGQLITANGWSAHSGAGTNAIAVTAPGLTYSGHPGSGVGNAVTMTTSGEDDNKPFTAITTGSAYMSFLVNVSVAQSAGDYFIGLFQSATVFPLRIYIKSDGAGGFFFGVGKSGTPVYESTSRTFGTTYFIVGNYIFNSGTTTDDVVNLWVNPALGGTETAATIPNVTGTAADGTSNAAVYLRQGTAASSPAQQVDAILAGTTWAQVTPAAASSALSASALTAFGNVCINTTVGPNSFTITGTGLSTANVTVGALAGYTYSTTAGGTYTTSLSLTQPGGAYSQQIFVKFTPTAIQSYNGNIPVGGGGATSINVAASGAGIDVPVVTTGAATLITSSSATLAGTIVANGCSAVTAYGVKYSTTAGFNPATTGTAVPSTNLSGGNFSSDLSGLTAATTYYYHAYATNGSGTGYGSEQSFTTTTGTPPTAGLIISQLYGNGGNAGATYTADYIELFNSTTSPITMSGYSIQYGSATTVTTWSGVFALPTATIPAGGYYLIQMSAAGTIGIAIPTPDATASPAINMSGSAGRVALVNGITALSACPTSASYVDLVGFGTTDICYQGSGPAGAPVSTTADFRKLNGCTQTNDNANDFEVLNALPRNSASPVNICGAPAPTLSATALTAFGNVCTNTTAGPNSFTITGTTLTAANITVGALAGFTYSTTAGGTYTTTLSLTQPGGAYSQIIYVKFSPVAVQSYSGNIPVGGGGATSINVAASGAGVNTIPSLTTGAASAITTTTATLAGTITANGCTAITAYGIEYSLTNNFPNGTGTPVASTNLSGGNFSSDLSGLTPGTTYYYHAYATNAGGTGYGAQQSFVTIAAPVLSATTLTAFGNVCTNTTAGPNSFTITGAALTAANVTVGALAGFTYSTTSGGTYTASLSLTQPGGAYSQQIFVKFNPTAVQSYDGNIVVGGGGASNINVAASGSGINSIPTLTTGAASLISSTSATLAGTINSTGCTAVTAYGIEYSTTNGFPNGTGTPVAASNLAGGNFSSPVSGLTPSTVYYYHAYATNGGGTGYGAQQTFTTATPTLFASALAAFGAQCINGTYGPNSFSLSGQNILPGNITIAALAGYTYSFSPAGPFTTTLSIPQSGGVVMDPILIYVKFSPTAVQSYNGNIVISGGGATPINVAASGSGINSIPTLTTGGATNITTTSADLAGTINSIGCSAITAYGVEYSLIPGFANGTGIPVASSNLSGGNFTSNASGLTPSTTYYYHAYATNSGGTGYGAEQFFTTGSLTPTLTTTGLAPFGAQCINNTYGPNSFTINGSALTNANVNVAALAGFTYSTTTGGTYTTTLSLAQPGGTYAQQIFVKFTPIAVQSYNGNIVISGGGAPTPANLAASGSGINTQATVTTGAASAITSTSATTAGNISANGCTAVTAYGIEYSTTNGFGNGTGTAVASTNIAGGNYTSNLTGLTPSTTYYYHAYATNGGGTAYGAQQQFTTLTPTLSESALTGFGNICLNTIAGPNSFTITGTNLTTANVTIGPLTVYTFSTTAGGTYTPSLNLTQPGGSYSQQIFVKFTPTAVQSYNGNIPVGGGGAVATNVAVTGAGINTQATVTTGAASAITSISATCAGSIPAIGCSAVTAYGIEYSTTNGFPNGTGTAVASGNLAGGNFSSNLTGLTPSTIYYYHAYATNGGGTAYGAQQQFTTATPVLSANALTGFGAVCLNTTAGPNSFTITGTNLTTVNVSIGPLAGYTFSTTAGGTYTASLSLIQPGGSYSQQIFVKFTPTVVQLYNGNIPVSGGGATAVNVAATGSGINSIATVTSGVASAITQISATVAGSIPSIGCSAITVYGIEYSLTNGFANGTGIAVTSTNLSGNNFSSSLTGLAPSTTYYYHAYATNNGGTAYGAQGSFTTLAPVLTSSTITGFGAVCLNTTAGPNSFTITSNALTAANVIVGPLAGYTFSTTAAGTYTASLSLTQPGGPYSQTIYVKFTPVAVQSYNGNIPVSGGGATVAISVGVTGSGTNTTGTVTTGTATVLSPNAATLNGSVVSIGCSPIISYGIEYSGINGFANGSGTQVPSTNLSGGSFSSTVNGLVQASTYYYKAYTVNNGGIAYGAQQSFTTSAIPDGLVIYSNPISRGGVIHFTLTGINPGHYAARIFNSSGQLVFQKDMIVAVNFIDGNLTLPVTLGSGFYSFQIFNPEFRIEKTFMIW